MSDVPLTTKVELTVGADFWHTRAIGEAGLPSVMITDGPHGVRKQAGASDHIGLNDSVPATCFPSAVALASSWDLALLEQVGQALGQECHALGVGVLLGPGLNLKRSPLCGRNFEYFSEDPLVSGWLATAFVRGVQSQGIGTSVKHFAVNNQETDRMRRDSQVDERTLRELYLRGFEKVVRDAEPWSVMCSYNKVNGTYASQNAFLLTEVLRAEWAFEGFVVSDWGAVSDPVAAIRAGLDLEMPANRAHVPLILEAVQSGELEEKTVEQAYHRIDTVLRRVVDTLAEPVETLDEAGHHDLARAAAARSIVLLENDGILPLRIDARVAVIGEFALTPRYQGAGSSRVHPLRLEDALTSISQHVGRPVAYAPGFSTDPARPVQDTAVADALAVAEGAEVVLMFLGLGEFDESEGYDRTTLELPAAQLLLLQQVAAVNPNVVAILSNGSSVLAAPVASHSRAVVEGWLLGQAGGSAMASVLFGEVSPSGKLTETIPIRLQDVPSYPYFPGDRSGVRYGEGLFVGYRGYDQLGTAVAYPFGHGLSYTHFDYSDLTLALESDSDLLVEMTVANSGTRAGRETVQVYVAVPESEVVRPPRELKGFAQVELAPLEFQRVTVRIGAADLAYWDVERSAWTLEAGQYLIEVGASSRDIRLRSTVRIRSDAAPRPLTLQSTMAEALAVPRFAELLQQMLPDQPGQTEHDLRMVAGIPLWSIAVLTGRSNEDLQALIDDANASPGPPAGRAAPSPRSTSAKENVSRDVVR